MSRSTDLSRRNLLKLIAASAPLAVLAKGKQIPIGLELYSVRDELKKDRTATLQAVSKMGYECVEFYAPYYEWTTEEAKQVRKQLDDLKLRCYSTHNDRQFLTPEGLTKAIELNKILGTRFIVLAHPGKEPASIDECKQLADFLNRANRTMESEGLHAGYHNHDLEWKPIDGQVPLQVIAANTDKSIMLQLDVGTCVSTGSDPVAWVNSHPGRIKSMHLKDWSPDQGYKVLFGEGVVPWKKLFAAAESKGGVEYYLIEQEGSRYPELETAERCIVAYRDLQNGKSSS
ncbi:MAG: sugar phosphate isomerase/epimerase [Acidobacteriaceae bacterium]|nr:sugar phosphate isomerase/epimerase [Acidobacteriaceae bacterium]MBV9501021.1 sugar phosphate isomerase/epimerase [Acidobacteriaceae bacterium]